MGANSKYYDVRLTPQNLRALWSAIHDNADALAAAQATIQQQAATIAAQQSQLATQQTQVQQALITAGKATSQTSQTNPSPGPGPGGGTGDAHPNHFALIDQAKTELVALGEDLTGPCGAIKIIQRAMPWIQASDPTAGFLDKPTGNNCNGFAVDIVCYTDGIIYDVLQDAGGANTPQWNFAGTVDPGRYRPTT